MAFPSIRGLLSNPAFYHYSRQIMTGGMPFKNFIHLAGLDEPSCRVADVGCGPADILRFVPGAGRPGYYLGIDVSNRYLSAAEKRARARHVDSTFLTMDLERLPVSEKVQSEFIAALTEHRATTVLLMGVLHHISDEAAAVTLDLIHQVPNVNTIVTQDVVTIPGHRLNNLLCDLDRGTFVRNEAGYESLMRRSKWRQFRREWTHTGVQFIKYINYVLSR
jgi:SAM-dependent methyltransferase